MNRNVGMFLVFIALILLSVIVVNGLYFNTPAVEKAEKEIMEGTEKIFVGPLKDQEGNLKVEDGVAMTDKELLSMDWFVAGVEGKIK